MSATPSTALPAGAHEALFAHWRAWMLEIGVLLAALLVVDSLWLGGDRFAGATPHPFWAVVLLASLHYGLAAGAVAALASTAALYFGAPPPEGDFYAAMGPAALKPALWLAAALVVGGLRTRAILKNIELGRELSDLKERSAMLANGLTQALDEIRRLEERIAGDTQTASAMLRATASLFASQDEPSAARVRYLHEVGVEARLFVRREEQFSAPDGETLSHALVRALDENGCVEATDLLPAGGLSALPVRGSSASHTLAIAIFPQAVPSDPTRRARLDSILRALGVHLQSRP